MNTPILAHAAKFVPILGWIFGFVVFMKTLFPKFGQYGVECKSMVCRWISVSDKGDPTDYDPEYFGTMVLMAMFALMFAINLASYIKVRVIKLSIFILFNHIIKC